MKILKLRNKNMRAGVNQSRPSSWQLCLKVGFVNDSTDVEAHLEDGELEIIDTSRDSNKVRICLRYDNISAYLVAGQEGVPQELRSIIINVLKKHGNDGSKFVVACELDGLTGKGKFSRRSSGGYGWTSHY